jgi:hypothetical protein
MTPDNEYGRTEFAPVTILLELAIDMFEGKELPPNLGKTEVPVHVVQGPTLDFAPTVPVLQLRLIFREGATPEQVAEDICRLFIGMNRVDLSHQGAGLLPGEISREGPTSNGTFSVTLKPAELNGAVERLARIASAISQVHDILHCSIARRRWYPALHEIEKRLFFC